MSRGYHRNEKYSNQNHFMSYSHRSYRTSRVRNFKYYVKLQQYVTDRRAYDGADGSPGGRARPAGAGSI